jgi:4-hydroxybenzoate polyprenyltransferase
MFRALIISLRPKQWIKNVFVFAPLVFAQAFTDFGSTLAAAQAFVIFSLAAGAVYLVNDILDREADRLHPKKKFRPIAAGQLDVFTASFAAAVFFAISGSWAYLFAPDFGAIIGGYVLLQAAYSLWLKHVFLFDILTIAFGFVLRVLGGAAVIAVPASSWLIVLTFLLTLLLAAGKREQEIKSLGSHATRAALEGYDLRTLGQAVRLLSAVTLFTYMAYTLLGAPTPWLLATVPCVSYAFWRYNLLLTQSTLLEAPEEFIYADRRFLVAGLLFVALTFLALLFG